MTDRQKTEALVLRADPELVDRVQQVADRFPEFEGRRSSVVRVAVREFTDRKLAQIQMEEEQAA